MADTNRSSEHVSMTREHVDAVRRVLRLMDRVMTRDEPETLLAIDGCLWTPKELRKHLKGALRLLPAKRRNTR